jgi:leader peptidase (prepilin peptidase)/N-methyltransferase
VDLYIAFYLVCLGIFGLIFGSFANVLIWRVPRGESIVSPPSHCPRCGHAVRWYDNLPIVSWLVLRARCRDCGEPIPVRYPVVESLSAALWVLAGVRWGVSASTPFAIAFLYLLLVLSAVDIDTRRLPTVLVAILAGVGIVGALLAQVTGLPVTPFVGVAPSGLLASPLATAAVGLVVGGGLAWGLAALYRAVRRRAGLGAGDIRLLGALGLFLGAYVLVAFLIANLAGLVGGLLQMTRGRNSADDTTPASIPFGPFLAGGAVVSVFAGPAIWQWYLRLLGLH